MMKLSTITLTILATLCLSAMVHTQAAGGETSTTTNKNFCTPKKCLYCVPSTADSTYKTCNSCGNSIATLASSASQATQTAGPTIPNDVYQCTGSATSVTNCIGEFHPTHATMAGCQYCKPGFKPVVQASQNGGSNKTMYNCVAHTITNCVAWDSTNDRCGACDFSYEMTSTYTCTKVSSSTQNRILQENGGSTSSSTTLIKNCKYHTYNTALKCWICEKRYGLDTTMSTCSTSSTKGCRLGMAGTETGTCQACSFEAGWFASDHGAASGNAYNQKCTFGGFSSIYSISFLLVTLAGMMTAM